MTPKGHPEYFKAVPACFLLTILIAFNSCKTPQPVSALKKGEKAPSPPGETLEVEILEPPRPPNISTLEKLPKPAPELDQPSTENTLSLLIRKMTLSQKIGQRLITWIPGTSMNGRVASLIEKGYVGGIILNSHNIASRTQVRELTGKLQQLALSMQPPIGLFIAVDQEGGRVSRLMFREITRFPPPFYLGEYNDPSLIRAVAFITGTEIRNLGCNMNLAPVLDLYPKADRTVIGDRSLGKDPHQVADFGVHYLEGAVSAGIIPVVKHFPGQGASTVDSHRALPVISASEEHLKEVDLVPFQAAVENGAKAVMTAHALYTDLDPEFPSTLSVKIVNQLLREQIGFNGVVISDAIEMAALRNTYSLETILERCIKAGIDLILINDHYDALDLKEILVSLVRSGNISEPEIDQGVKRILRLKMEYNLIPSQIGYK